MNKMEDLVTMCALLVSTAKLHAAATKILPIGHLANQSGKFVRVTHSPQATGSLNKAY